MWWLKFSNLLLWAPTSPFTKRLFNWEFVSPVDKCFPAVWICTILGQPIAFPASRGRVIFSLCPGLGELGRLGGILGAGLSFAFVCLEPQTQNADVQISLLAPQTL